MIVFKWLRTLIEASRISARNSRNFSDDGRRHRIIMMALGNSRFDLVNSMGSTTVLCHIPIQPHPFQPMNNTSFLICTP